ncbi:MAG: TetR family transcriptional regulator C-terminal domain-containing protein [Gemmatimonadaceae bacterium]
MAKQTAAKRVREPDVTREKLLHAAFEEIHRRGFQAASIDSILAATGVTKGALYHHFPSKADLGYAVVDEMITGILLDELVQPLDQFADDPITGLQRVLRNKYAIGASDWVPLGCPLQNLAQEMSPLDETFRSKLKGIFDTWRSEFAKALERGQADGTVRKQVDTKKVAAFVVAAVEGSIGLAKNARSPQLLRSNLEVLDTYLDELRPSKNRRLTRPSRLR